MVSKIINTSKAITIQRELFLQNLERKLGFERALVHENAKKFDKKGVTV